MIKLDIAKAVAVAADLTHVEAKAAVEEVLASLKQALVNGERIEIRGFGVLFTRLIRGSTGRNPRTGRIIPKGPDWRAVRFKPGKDLQNLPCDGLFAQNGTSGSTLTLETPAVYPPKMRTGFDRRRRLILAVLATFALCTGLFIESFATHTDDGCVVESHCLACRLTVGGIAVASVTTPLLDRAPEMAERVAIHDEQLRSESVAVILPSRAPPTV